MGRRRGAGGGQSPGEQSPARLPGGAHGAGGLAALAGRLLRLLRRGGGGPREGAAAQVSAPHPHPRAPGARGMLRAQPLFAFSHLCHPFGCFLPRWRLRGGGVCVQGLAPRGVMPLRALGSQTNGTSFRERSGSCISPWGDRGAEPRGWGLHGVRRNEGVPPGLPTPLQNPTGWGCWGGRGRHSPCGTRRGVEQRARCFLGRFPFFAVRL